jgi:putative transposase
VLKQAEAGAETKELCRKHGLSEATFHNWKAKYAGMTVSEARRMKELEAENSKLKRLLVDAEPDKAALKDLLGRKKMVSPQARREAVTMLMTERDFGVTGPFGLLRISRSL